MNQMSMANLWYCSQCGFIGKRQAMIKGSVLIELVLWITFIVPGIIYSIWRSTSRAQVCPRCRAANMIPATSPLARTAIEANPAVLAEAQTAAAKYAPVPMTTGEQIARLVIFGGAALVVLAILVKACF